MRLYDSFSDDSYSTYSIFDSFKEIYLSDKCYIRLVLSRLISIKLGAFDLFLHERILKKDIVLSCEANIYI